MTSRPEELPPVPSVDRYVAGLRGLGHFMSPTQRLMLLKHYRAPDHTVTATELAELVGLPDWNSINLHYGTFAKSLADRMRWPVPPGAQASYTIAWFEKPEDAEKHWRWIMHPEVAAAIESLGWAKPKRAS